MSGYSSVNVVPSYERAFRNQINAVTGGVIDEVASDYKGEDVRELALLIGKALESKRMHLTLDVLHDIASDVLL